MTARSPRRLEKTLCRSPRTPPTCVDKASKIPPSRIQHASKPQENRQYAPRSPMTLPRHPNTPPNDAQDASETPQNDSKTHWHRLKINHLERCTHGTRMKKTNLHQFEVLQIPAPGTHALTVLTCCFFHDHDFAATT